MLILILFFKFFCPKTETGIVDDKKKDEKSSPYLSTETRQISKKKIWCFRIVAVIILPIIIFGGLEVGLRFFWQGGYPTKAVIQRKIDGKPKYCHNLQFGWRFFPKNIAREFSGFVFETEKSPKSYRIFVLGASAAAGTPSPLYNFGRILEVMLSDMYPDIDFEVHNAAMVAINSHVVLEIAKDCAEYDPDLFIVYLGNNEVIGPFGPGTVFAPLSPSLSVIRAYIAVKSTRIGQLLELAVPRNKRLHAWGGMEMYFDKQVRHNSADLNSVYSHYEKNLQDICNAARRGGADIIVSNIGVNLKDSPPFVSLHRRDLTDIEKQRWEEIYQLGTDYEARSEYRQAIARYLTAAEIDETFADLQFRLGRNYWQFGDYKTARQHYLKALQYDTLRFRSDARLNEIIRSVAQARDKEGIYFADSISAFEENSPHQTPGEELFYEHVHLKFKGNYILAKTIFSQLQKILPASFNNSQKSVLSEKQCAERLPYTDFERHQDLVSIQGIIGKYPFTNQLYHDDSIGKGARQIEDLSAHIQQPRLKDLLSQHKNAIQKKPDDWRLPWQYASFLHKGLKDKDTQAEEVQLRKVIQRCPYAPAYLSLSDNLFRQGKLDETRKILYQLLEIKPNSAEAHFHLAVLAQNSGDIKGTIKHLTQGINIQPTCPIKYYRVLASIYKKVGKPKKAIQTLYNAIEVLPEEETAGARSDLGYLLTTQGK